MRIIERTAVVVAIVVGLAGCGGGSARPAPTTAKTEGASSPEVAVESFLQQAQTASRSRAAGEFTLAESAYDEMAALFGTEKGSIVRSLSAQEVRSRMLVLSACLRPQTYRIISSPDPDAWTRKQTIVTIELTRAGSEAVNLAFTVVLGRGDRWFIERIDLSDFSC